MITVAFIRSTLWSLYCRRRHTVQRLREGGRNMREQIEALEAIKTQLEVSGNWSLHQHVAMVAGLKKQIVILLTVTFIREVKYRTRIVDLIDYCQGQHNQPTLFS